MHRHTHPHILTHHRYRHTHTIHKQTIRCTRTMYISVSAMGQLPSPPAKWNKGWHPTDTSALLQSTNHWHFSSITEHYPLTLQLCHRALSIDTSALSQSTIHWHFSSVTEHYPLTLQLCHRALSIDTSAPLQSAIHWHFSSVTEHYPLTLQLHYRAPSTDTSAPLQSTMEQSTMVPSTDTDSLLMLDEAEVIPYGHADLHIYRKVV